MADLDPRQHPAMIDWEAFYADYRKPDFIPGFEILQKLGAGAFGLVFKARKHSIGKDYAIKFLKVDDATVRDAVLHELDTVRLFAQIDHPNLVSIEDMGHVNGIPFIVMGYAGEETLALRQKAGQLPRDEALRIFLQVCRGVQALHERMLVHFDLKPANVYLKGDTARVGDYGLSKLVTASRRSLSFGRGTTYYMAPEVLRRRGDHRSDIYSLGVMLYESLVGDLPFRGDSEWEVLKKHESEAPAYPAGLAPGDRAALEACLQKDPDHRAQSIDEVVDRLQRYPAAGAPRARTAPLAAAAAPAGAHREPGGPAPRRSRPLLLLASVALLVLGFGMFLPVGAPSVDPRAAATAAPPAPRPVRAAAVRVGPGSATSADAEVGEFHERLDAAIAALQHLREADVRMAEVRTKALEALGTTLRNLDFAGLRGQDPWKEALLQAIRAGLEKAEVRDRWADLADSILPPLLGSPQPSKKNGR
jgi:hypothetical protein